MVPVLSKLGLVAALVLVGCQSPEPVEPLQLPPDARLLYYGDGSFSGVPLPDQAGTYYLFDAMRGRVARAMWLPAGGSIKFRELERGHDFGLYFVPDERTQADEAAEE